MCILGGDCAIRLRISEWIIVFPYTLYTLINRKINMLGIYPRKSTASFFQDNQACYLDSGQNEDPEWLS